MQTLILDSSQISTWFGCSQEWANRGLIAINKAAPEETLRPGEALAAGSLIHKYLEIYYTVLSTSGGDGKLAARAALDFDPDEADKIEKQFPLDAALREKVKNRFVDYLLCHPPESDYKPATKSKHIVTAADGVLVDAFVHDPLIEKGFSYKLFESSEYLFVLEGRIDFVGTAQDGTLLWMDHKSQFREHQLYPKAIQFRNYALATGLNLAVINYIRFHDKIGPKTFVRQPLSFSSLEMRNWKEELTDIYVRIAKEVVSGEFPQNRNSCGGQWGRPCQFTPLCEEYNPATREAIRKRDFVARKEWKPW
jgi:hypothetical protein